MKYRRKRIPVSASEGLAHAARVDAAMAPVGKRVLEVTTPVYTLDRRGRPDVEGSGILLAIADRRFLVTAAHVANADRPLGYVAGKGILPLKRDRQIRAWAPGNQSGDDSDTIDVAVFLLDGVELADLPTNTFLTLAEARRLPATISPGPFLVAGYPRSRQNGLLHGSQQGAELHQYFVKESGEWLYQRAGCRIDGPNIVLGYDEEQIWDARHGLHHGPSLRGMSGGGVWLLPGRISAPTGPPQLVGILHECVQRTDKYLVATRFDVVALAIYREMPELRTSLRISGFI